MSKGKPLRKVIKMLKIEVKSTDLISRTSKKTGAPYFQQQAWVDLPNGERRQIMLYIGNDQVKAQNDVYPVGNYTIDPSSFGVQYNSLEIGFLKLQPLGK